MTAIGDYGLIGDTRTAALCSTAGSIDWLCVPRFDAEPVFGRLVGGDRAGSFRLAPSADAQLARRRYYPGSAVLETTWRTDGGGELVLTEGLVADVSGRLLPTFCGGQASRRHPAAAAHLPRRFLYPPRPQKSTSPSRRWGWSGRTYA